MNTNDVWYDVWFSKALGSRFVMDLSVVIPIFNEQDNIEPLVEEIQAALTPLDLKYEIIYVDDGSTDAGLERLFALQAHISQLRILHHAQSCGQSTAIHTGVRAARAPWIATLDGDGQNDPADIPRLYQALRQATEEGSNLAMIAGWRKKRQDSFSKRIASRLANGIRAKVLGDATPDTGCGLKVFSREVFLELPYFDHMHRFLPALVQRAGKEVRSLEVNHRPRHKGQSKYGLHNRLWTGIIDLLGVFWLKRRAKHPQIQEYLPTSKTS